MRIPLPTFVRWLAVSVAIALAPTVGRSQGSASLIIVGGHVVTVDSAKPEAEAIAIAGDRILAVGTNAETRTLATRARSPESRRRQPIHPVARSYATHLARRPVCCANRPRTSSTAFAHALTRDVRPPSDSLRHAGS